MKKRFAEGGTESEWWWQLKVEVIGVAPAVWRRVFVPQEIRLSKLHRVLQTVMGWSNSHSHEFIIDGVGV